MTADWICAKWNFAGTRNVPKCNLGTRKHYCRPQDSCGDPFAHFVDQVGERFFVFDLFAFVIGEVKGVEGGSFFRGDACGNQVESRFGNGTGDAIEEAGVVGGLDVEKGMRARGAEAKKLSTDIREWI